MAIALRTILPALLIAAFLVGPASLVRADDEATDTKSAADILNEGLSTAAGEAGFEETPTSVYTIASNIVGIAFGLLGILFFALILYAGFLYLTSLGETEPLTKAKKILSSSIIGLLITLGAYAIASYLLSALIRAV